MPLPPPGAPAQLAQLMQGGQGAFPPGSGPPMAQDPRAAAIAQMLQQQGGPSRMPVVPPDAQMQSSMNPNPDAVMTDQGDYPEEDPDDPETAANHRANTAGEPPDPGMVGEPEGPADNDLSDEEMLDRVQEGISPQGASPQLKQQDRGRYTDNMDDDEIDAFMQFSDKMEARGYSQQEIEDMWEEHGPGAADRGMQYPPVRPSNMPSMRRRPV
jgi:hypothetical protein